MGLNSKILADKPDSSAHNPIETGVSRIKGNKLRIANACIYRLPVWGHFVHTVNGYPVKNHGQYKGLNTGNDRGVIILPPQFECPVPVLAKGTRPKIIGLFLCGLYPELGQAGKYLLHRTCRLVAGLNNLALKEQHAPQNERHKQRIDQPDHNRRRRKFHAVIAHQKNTPKGEDKGKNGGDKFTGYQIFGNADAPHAAGQFPHGKTAEKTRGQGHQPAPQRRFGSDFNTVGYAQYGNGTHDRQRRRGKTGHQQRLRYRSQPLPVQDGNDILKNRLRNNRRGQWNKSGKQTADQYRAVIGQPALTKHELH